MDAETFVREYYVPRKGTNCIKWDILQEAYGNPDLLPLWVADMDFKTCPEVLEALRERIAHGAFGYSLVPDSFYEAFAAWEAQYGYTPDKSVIRFSAGVVTMLYRLVRCFTEPGDQVLILTPVYYPFRKAIEENGRTAVQVDLREDGSRFVIDYEAVERAVAAQDVKMTILCSPHNPVGRVFTEEELSELLGIFGRHGVLVVSDEIHQDFHFEEHTQHCLIGVRDRLQAAGEKMPEVISLTAPSKTFNLASLGFSVAMFPDEEPRNSYDAYMKALGEPGVDILAATAAEAAYRYGAEWLSGVKAVILQNHRRIRERLAAECPAIRIMDLEGTYLPFMDLRGVVDIAHPMKPPIRIAGSETNADIADLVQNKAGLAVDYGEWFGKNFAGFIRLNLATHPDIVEEAVTRLIRAAGSVSKPSDA